METTSSTLMTTASISPRRRYELDWLRVIAIALVFLFHSGRFFDAADWHVKNAVTYPQFDMVALFVTSWMMPLIFAVSGASVFFAVGKSHGSKFLQSKVLRLLIPVLVAVFTHLPLQVYLERRTHHQFVGSFWDFLPHYFDGIYGWGNGNFAITGMHLWYLLLLFCFTVLCAPLFHWLRRGSGQKALRHVVRFLALPGTVYLLALLVALALNQINPNRGVGAVNLGGWSFPIYIIFYLAGFLLYADAAVIERVRQLRWVSLLIAALSLALLLQQISGRPLPVWGTDRYRQLSVAYALCSWCWILTFLGFARHYLTTGTASLAYANEAVLPFYIMHQTVLLAVGYVVVRWTIADGLKWVIITASSLAIILVLYAFFVRRFNWLRFLFGMKLLPKKVATPQPAAMPTIGD